MLYKTDKTTYPPQSQRFNTKLPRKRTCEYSTSTAVTQDTCIANTQNKKQSP